MQYDDEKRCKDLRRRASRYGRVRNLPGAGTAGIYQYHNAHPRSARSLQTGCGGCLLCRGKAGICLPRSGKSGRYSGEFRGTSGFYVPEYDVGDERYLLRVENRLQETRVSRFVLHLSAHGAAADEGGLPADIAARGDERGICPRKDCRSEVLRVPEQTVWDRLYLSDADQSLWSE